MSESKHLIVKINISKFKGTGVDKESPLVFTATYTSDGETDFDGFYCGVDEDDVFEQIAAIQTGVTRAEGEDEILRWYEIAFDKWEVTLVGSLD